MAKSKFASFILREKGMFNSYFIIISDDAPSWLNQLGTTLKKEFPDNQKCVYTLVKETLAFIDKNPTSSFDEFICHQYKLLSYLEDSDIFEWASEMCTTKVFKDVNESLNIVSSASIIDALISIYKEVTKKIVKIVYDAYNNRVTQEKAVNDLLNQINAVIKKYQYNHGKIEKKFTYFLDLLNYIRGMECNSIFNYIWEDYKIYSSLSDIQWAHSYNEKEFGLAKVKQFSGKVSNRCSESCPNYRNVDRYEEKFLTKPVYVWFVGHSNDNRLLGYLIPEKYYDAIRECLNE